MYPIKPIKQTSPFKDGDRSDDLTSKLQQQLDFGIPSCLNTETNECAYELYKKSNSWCGGDVSYCKHYRTERSLLQAETTEIRGIPTPKVLYGCDLVKEINKR